MKFTAQKIADRAREEGHDVYKLKHAFRINGVVDVWKNDKTVFTIPENDYSNFEDMEQLASHVFQKLEEHEPRERFKKTKTGNKSYKEFRNDKHNEEG